MFFGLRPVNLKTSSQARDSPSRRFCEGENGPGDKLRAAHVPSTAAQVTTAGGPPRSGRPKLPFSPDTTNTTSPPPPPPPPLLLLLVIPPPPPPPTPTPPLPRNPSQVTLCPNMPSATATNSSVSVMATEVLHVLTVSVRFSPLTEGFHFQCSA